LLLNSMEPTDAERALIIDAKSLADWVGISDEARAAWFAVLGVSDTSMLRLVASLPESVILSCIDTLRIADIPPSPALACQLGLWGATARVMLGIQPSLAALEERRVDELSRPPALATGLGHVALAARPAVASHRVKLSNAVDQLYDEEIDVVPVTVLQEAYDIYSAKLGGVPAEDEDVTAEQFSSMKHLILSNRPPYADFAVFGPFGQRLRRKVKFHGYNIGANGQLARVELLGPASFEEWRKSYAILRTALIMLEQVDPAALDAYSANIERLSRRYGTAIWTVLYQADVRMRLEQMERIRRRGVEAHREAVESGGIHPYSTMKPWGRDR
jgi:hypothetical protein